MKLTLGFSPCPNDTFIFEAMVHGRVDTEGLEFDWFLADVEELNRRAVEGSVDITKMSFHAYARTAQKYLILDSGSALGRSNGPPSAPPVMVKPPKTMTIRTTMPMATNMLPPGWPVDGRDFETVRSREGATLVRTAWSASC